MNKLYFLIIMVIVIISCNNSDKQNKTNTIEKGFSEDRSVINSKDINDTIKSKFNGDSLKLTFSKTPFNYTFRDERTVDGTSETHVEGFEDEINYQKDVDLPNKIVINYNLTSRKATSITFYLNHFKTDNVKLADCKSMIEFIDFFDPEASKYLQRNFKTIFYNEAAYEGLTNYKTNVIEMIIDHNLFDTRKFDKENKESTTSQSIDCTIKFL